VTPKTESGRITAEINRNGSQRLCIELQSLLACLTFAGLAENGQRTGDSEDAARSLAYAKKAYAKLLRFLSDPKHADHIPEAERAELSTGMEQLRARLDELQERYSDGFVM
jgi:hypothetical protein